LNARKLLLKTLINISSVFLLLFTFHSISLPQGINNLDFFPIEIGNKWQYKQVETFMDSVLSESYCTVEALFDTIMPNGKKYTSFGGIRYFRIDSTHFKVYKYITYCDSTMEMVIYDLSQPSSNIGEPYNWTDECFGFSCCQSEYEYDQVGITYLDSLIYKRYAGYGEHYNFLALGIGKCYFEEGDIGYSREEFLVAAEINGVTYGEFFVGIRDENLIPKNFKLYQPRPNPFNPTTTIRFIVDATHASQLRVYDITGRLVETLLDETLTPGEHEVMWNASHMPSGVYCVRLQSGKFIENQKVLLLK